MSYTTFEGTTKPRKRPAYPPLPRGAGLPQGPQGPAVPHPNQNQGGPFPPAITQADPNQDPNKARSPFTFTPETDPIFGGAKADAERALAAALAGDTKGEQDLLTGLGDRGFAQSVLGDWSGLGAISDDPNSISTLGRIAHDYNDTVTGAEDALNKHNLFYSGARGKELTGLAHQKQTAVYDAHSKVQSLLSQINQQRLAQRQAHDDAIRAAMSDAWNRQITAYLNSIGGG